MYIFTNYDILVPLHWRNKILDAFSFRKCGLQRYESDQSLSKRKI